jgi:hypothetical protein
VDGEQSSGEITLANGAPGHTPAAAFRHPGDFKRVVVIGLFNSDQD